MTLKEVLLEGYSSLDVLYSLKMSSNPVSALVAAALPIAKSKKLQNQLIHEIETGAGSLLTPLQEGLERITLRDLGLEDPNTCFEPGLISFINVYPYKVMWIGVYCMSQGSRFPLHDHPDMIGIARQFRGCVRYRNLDIVSCTGGVSEARVVAEGVASGPGMLMLTPNKGNIHEIDAVEDSVLLDLFLPNYGKSRICTYFEEIESRDDRVLLRPLTQPDIPSQECRYEGLPAE